MNFLETESILLNCFPRPPVGALHVPRGDNFDNKLEFIVVNLTKDNYCCQLNADRIVSLELHFKMQFGNCNLHSPVFMTLHTWCPDKEATGLWKSKISQQITSCFDLEIDTKIMTI